MVLEQLGLACGCITVLTLTALHRGYLDSYGEAAHEAAEALGERAVHVGGERVLMKTSSRLFKRVLRRCLTPCAHYLRRFMFLFNITIPLLSAGIVIHAAVEDASRAQEDSIPTRIGLFFLFAALCDLMDALVHLVVLYDYATSFSLEKEFMEKLELFGLLATVVAILAIVFGELLVVRFEEEEKKDKKKES